MSPACSPRWRESDADRRQGHRRDTPERSATTATSTRWTAQASARTSGTTSARRSRTPAFTEADADVSVTYGPNRCGAGMTDIQVGSDEARRNFPTCRLGDRDVRDLRRAVPRPLPEVLSLPVPRAPVRHLRAHLPRVEQPAPGVAGAPTAVVARPAGQTHRRLTLECDSCSGRSRTHANARRARKLAAQATWPAAEVGLHRGARHHGPCVYCGDPPTHVDRIRPPAQGGHEARYNLRARMPAVQPEQGRQTADPLGPSTGGVRNRTQPGSSGRTRPGIGGAYVFKPPLGWVVTLNAARSVPRGLEVDRAGHRPVRADRSGKDLAKPISSRDLP